VQLFSHDTKADALARAPLFRALSREDLVTLAKVTEDLEVEAGKVLAREGDIGQEVSVVRDGEELRKLGPGDFFGEIALIWDSPRRTATVTATKPLRFFVLTRQAFKSLIKHHAHIEKCVLDALEERVHASSPSSG
jgi:CRP-like cAMP-binding protein